MQLAQEMKIIPSAKIRGFPTTTRKVVVFTEHENLLNKR
jgi:hypothetical protein